MAVAQTTSSQLGDAGVVVVMVVIAVAMVAIIEILVLLVFWSVLEASNTCETIYSARS